MGYSSFRLDLNFAFLLYYQLMRAEAGQRGEHTNDLMSVEPSSSAQMKLLNMA